MNAAASQRPGVVHVIDDDAAMRDSLDFLLDTAGVPHRVYESASEFLDVVEKAEPGCVLSDIRMPDIDGLELLRRLRERGAPYEVVLMTGHADVPLAIQSMKLGVSDFLEKPFDDDALLAALDVALSTGEHRRGRDAELSVIAQRMASLSPRENDVLEGLVAGRANKVIAYDLGISPRTVEIYRANVMTKMQAASLSELVRMSLVLERDK